MLAIAEIELPSMDTPFPDLPWLGREVTRDHRYANQTSEFEGMPDTRSHQG